MNAFINTATKQQHKTLPNSDHLNASIVIFKSITDSVETPEIVVNEMTGSYKVKYHLAGYKREHFYILVEDGHLYIWLIHREGTDTHARPTGIQDPDFMSMHCDLQLPKDADISRTNAEYIDGQLTLHFPKALAPRLVQTKKIPVY